MRHWMRTALAGGTIGVIASPSVAQIVERVDRAEDPEQAVLILDHWAYDPLYTNGWSVDDVLEQTIAVDPSGTAIGDLDNLVFSDDGRLLAFIVELDRTWDIAETHVRIPWEEAVLSDDTTELHLPITEETLGSYSIFDRVGDRPPPRIAKGSRAQVVPPEADPGSDAFRATDLIGDFASVEDMRRYGYVSDLIVRGDAIAALVIQAAGIEPTGPRAYPYPGYRSWVDPEDDTRFRMPFTSEQADVIENFDYDRLTRRSAD